MKKIIYPSAFLILAAFLGGCATIEEGGFERPTPVVAERAESKPTEINLSGDLQIDLPDEYRSGVDIPNVRGYYSIKIRSEYIDETESRSKYRTELTLRVTSLDGTQELVNINAASNGEYDGSPNQAIGTAFEQVMETIGIYGKALQQTSENTETETIARVAE